MRAPSPRAAGRAATAALTPDHTPESARELVFPPDPPDERDVTPPAAAPHAVHHVPGAKEVTRHTLEVLAFRVAATPLAFGLVVVQARFLDEAGRGRYVLAVLGVTALTRLLGDIGSAATNQIRDEREQLGVWTAIALQASIALGLVGAILVAGFGRAAGDVPLTLALLTGLAVAPNLTARSLSGILLGLARVRLWNVIQVLPAAASFAGFAVLVIALDLGVYGAVLAYVLGHALAAAVALAATHRLWWPLLLRKLPLRSTLKLLRLAVAMGVVSFVGLVNYRIELFVLGQYHDEAAVGVYSIAVTVAESLWLITTAIATGIWAPAIHSEERRAAALVARSALKGLVFVSAAGGVLALLAPFGLPLVFGERYDPAVGPLHYLLPGIAVYAPVQVLTIYLSVRRGRPGFALVGPMLSLVVTTLLALALVPEHAGEGAAIASSAGYVVSALVVWGFFLRLARLP